LIFVKPRLRLNPKFMMKLKTLGEMRINAMPMMIVATKMIAKSMM
jgi:hypothetical protein